MRLSTRLSRKIYVGREGHSDHGSAPIEDGYLFDSDGFALCDSEGFLLDTIE